MEAILWLQLSQYEATLRGNTLTPIRVAAPASDTSPHRLQEVPIPRLSDRISAEDAARLLAQIQGVYPEPARPRPPSPGWPWETSPSQLMSEPEWA
jgi:hypothetical protein